METTVKVYLRDEQGNEDWFVTPINLSEQEVRKYYLGNIFNMGCETDHMMTCYKVEIIKSSN